jgi:cytochrome b6-f complex iron-sulfur subunit
MSSEDTNKINRRTFIKTTAAGGALITIGGMTVGCGNDVSAAPKQTVERVTSTPAKIQTATIHDGIMTEMGYGQITLLVSFYPDLVPVGGALTLELPNTINADEAGYVVPPDATVLVIHRGAGQFIAVQSSCPHAGCPLGYVAKADRIECPCHSSRFYADPDAAAAVCIGQINHPPAAAPLLAWQTTAAPTADGSSFIVTIDLKTTINCEGGVFPPVVNGTLTLPLADFPQLTMAGGAVGGQPAGLANPIVVIRVDAANVVALNSRCTHRGCTVAWSAGAKELECPCHGSAFAPDGRVLSPPATRPLASYPVTLNADSVVVTVV